MLAQCRMARLAGVEPAARGFEGRTLHRPGTSLSVPIRHYPHGYRDTQGRTGTRRDARGPDPCHAGATGLRSGTIPGLKGRWTEGTEVSPGGRERSRTLAQRCPGRGAARGEPRDCLPVDRARCAACGPRWGRPAHLPGGLADVPRSLFRFRAMTVGGIRDRTARAVPRLTRVDRTEAGWPLCSFCAQAVPLPASHPLCRGVRRRPQCEGGRRPCRFQPPDREADRPSPAAG